MLSMQMSNLPFYVLKRQKCVNVRNICPFRMIVGFSGFRQRILQGEGTHSGGGGGELRPPSELCLHILCKL